MNNYNEITVDPKSDSRKQEATGGFGELEQGPKVRALTSVNRIIKKPVFCGLVFILSMIKCQIAAKQLFRKFFFLPDTVGYQGQ